MHTIVSVEARPASGPGALAHHEATCSCGARYGNSLGERWARKDGQAHADYMNAKAAR